MQNVLCYDESSFVTDCVGAKPIFDLIESIIGGEIGRSLEVEQKRSAASPSASVAVGRWWCHDDDQNDPIKTQARGIHLMTCFLSPSEGQAHRKEKRLLNSSATKILRQQKIPYGIFLLNLLRGNNRIGINFLDALYILLHT